MNGDGKVVIDTRLDSSGAVRDAAGLKGKLSKTIAPTMKVLGGITTAGTVAVGAAIRVGSSFEAGMSKVSAISGATGKDLDLLTEKAKEMGIKTKFSASDASEALTYMAMAGWKTEDMLGGLEGIMNLAAATGEDLASTSDIVTDALTAFGLQAEDSSHFADILAAASSNANTNVSMLGESFKYVAPVAGSLGFSAEDTSKALALMANSGIKASSAGTALRGMLTRLVSPTKQSQKVIDQLGISVTDNKGKMKSLDEIMKDLRKGFANLSEDEKASAASALAGKTAMSGLLAIVNSSEKDYNKLSKAINNCEGETDRMAATMQNNLQGQITLLKSSLEGLGIALYDNISGQSTNFIKVGRKYIEDLQKGLSEGGTKGLTNAVGKIIGDVISKIPKFLAKVKPVLFDFTSSLFHSLAKNLPKEFRPIAETIADLYDKLIPKISKAFKDLWNVIKSVVGIFSKIVTYFRGNKTAVDLLVSSIIALTVAMYTYKGLQVASIALSKAQMFWTQLQIAKLYLQEGATIRAALAQAELNGAMLLNPYILMTAAVAGLAAGLIYYSKKQREAKTEIELDTEKRLDNVKKIKEQTKEQEKLNKQLRESVEQTQKNIDGEIIHGQYLENLAGKLDDLVDSKGNVKKADEDSVKFILSELNNALGTEYKLVDGQIKGYDKLKKSIEGAVKAKISESLAATAQEDFTNALKESSKAQDEATKSLETYSKKREKAIEVEKSGKEKIRKLDEKIKETQERAQKYKAYYLQDYIDEYEKEKKQIQDNIDAYKLEADSAKDNYKSKEDAAALYYAEMVKNQAALYAAAKGDNDRVMEIMSENVESYLGIGSSIAKNVANGMSQKDVLNLISDSSKTVATKGKDKLEDEFGVKAGSSNWAKNNLGKPLAKGTMDGWNEENPMKQIADDFKNNTFQITGNIAEDIKANLDSIFNYRELGTQMRRAFTGSNIGVTLDGRQVGRVTGKD